MPLHKLNIRTFLGNLEKKLLKIESDLKNAGYIQEADDIRWALIFLEKVRNALQ